MIRILNTWRTSLELSVYLLSRVCIRFPANFGHWVDYGVIFSASAAVMTEAGSKPIVVSIYITCMWHRVFVAYQLSPCTPTCVAGYGTLLMCRSSINPVHPNLDHCVCETRHASLFNDRIYGSGFVPQCMCHSSIKISCQLASLDCVTGHLSLLNESL